MKSIVQHVAPIYGGKPGEDDGYEMPVKFENLRMAAMMIDQHGLETIARIESDGNGVSETSFTKPITILFRIVEKERADA